MLKIAGGGMPVSEYLIETDVLSDYLMNPGHTLMDDLMMTGTCFTTLFNVSELYELAETEEEVESVGNLLDALHILGIPGRYGLHTKEFEKFFDNVRDRLFCIPAKLNKMKIVSMNPGRYESAGLEIYK